MGLQLSPGTGPTAALVLVAVTAVTLTLRPRPDPRGSLTRVLTSSAGHLTRAGGNGLRPHADVGLRTSTNTPDCLLKPQNGVFSS